MPMREDCRHFATRLYDDGEAARFCVLDLAPEAPWRCPADCSGYAARRMDAGWHYGSLGQPAPAPASEPAGDDVAALLEAAEDIVNRAASDIVADQTPKRRRRRGKKGR